MLWNCGERLDRYATPMRHGPCDIAARFALTPNHVMPRGESGQAGCRFACFVLTQHCRLQGERGRRPTGDPLGSMRSKQGQDGVSPDVT